MGDKWQLPVSGGDQVSCPVWVKFRPRRTRARGPLCPHQRTSQARRGMSERCQQRPLTGFEARARQAALSLVTIHVIHHAAAVLSVTSTRAEGEAGALLQTLAQRRTHQRAWRPGAAIAVHVAHKAECALDDHLAGRAVARIAVARDYRLDPSAIRQLAQEEDVVEALLTLCPSSGLRRV